MYVLILSFVLNTGYAGLGGVAMHEFDTLEACNAAASKWEDQITKGDRKLGKHNVMSLCVKKGD